MAHMPFDVLAHRAQKRHSVFQAGQVGQFLELLAQPVMVDFQAAQHGDVFCVRGVIAHKRKQHRFFFQQMGLAVFFPEGQQTVYHILQ